MAATNQMTRSAPDSNRIPIVDRRVEVEVVPVEAREDGRYNPLETHHTFNGENNEIIHVDRTPLKKGEKPRTLILGVADAAKLETSGHAKVIAAKDDNGVMRPVYRPKVEEERLGDLVEHEEEFGHGASTAHTRSVYNYPPRQGVREGLAGYGEQPIEFDEDDANVIEDDEHPETQLTGAEDPDAPPSTVGQQPPGEKPPVVVEVPVRGKPGPKPKPR